VRPWRAQVGAYRGLVGDLGRLAHQVEAHRSVLADLQDTEAQAGRRPRSLCG
jgi:hypothetical protein